MAVDLTRALLLIVGLGPGVAVTEVRGHGGGPLVVGVELAGRPCCGGCGGKVHRHGAGKVSLADLPAFGRPVRLVWNKRRWLCPDGACAVRTFTDQNPAVAWRRGRVPVQRADEAHHGHRPAHRRRPSHRPLGLTQRDALPLRGEDEARATNDGLLRKVLTTYLDCDEPKGLSR